MDESKKPLVSLRLSHADLERLGTLAKRLRARESEIIRFALRLAFARLALLLDENARGRDLIPVFLECGAELTSHFDLDPRTLDAIVNGVLDDPLKKVDGEDIELISMLHLPGRLPRAMPRNLSKQEIGRHGFPGALRHYLYEKYIEPSNRFVGLEKILTSFLQVPL
jgi:hypothetical protein